MAKSGRMRGEETVSRSGLAWPILVRLDPVRHRYSDRLVALSALVSAEIHSRNATTDYSNCELSAR